MGVFMLVVPQFSLEPKFEPELLRTCGSKCTSWLPIRSWGWTMNDQELCISFIPHIILTKHPLMSFHQEPRKTTDLLRIRRLWDDVTGHAAYIPHQITTANKILHPLMFFFERTLHRVHRETGAWDRRCELCKICIHPELHVGHFEKLEVWFTYGLKRRWSLPRLKTVKSFPCFPFNTASFWARQQGRREVQYKYTSTFLPHS